LSDTSWNVFDALEAEFAGSPLMSATLVEHGECGAGVPEANIRVQAARDIVHDPMTSLIVCDAIFAALLRCARTRPESWQLAAIWTMLPGLRAITRRLRRTWWSVDVQDIRSDVLVGFLDALRRTDPTRENLGAHLWWATYRHARQPCEQATREITSEDIDTLAARAATADHATTPPANLACSGGVTAPPTDTPINGTRLEGERLGSIAHRLGLHTRAGGHARRAIGYLTLHNTGHRHDHPTETTATGTDRREDAA
jgi:hypothetical protein